MVDPSHFLLELIAITEPKVKHLLLPPPEKLYVSLIHVGGPPETATEGLVTAQYGDRKESVTVKLEMREDLQMLFNALLKGESAQSINVSPAGMDENGAEGDDVG